MHGISTKKYSAMTKKEARELFIDYMYGGLDINTQQKLEKVIGKYPELKTELEGLMETRKVLQQMPVEQPKKQIVIMEPISKHSSIKNWWTHLQSFLTPQSTFGRYGTALASFALFFMLIGSLTDMNLSWDNEGFSISYGKQVPQQTGYTAEQVEMLIEKIQAENSALFVQILEANQQQQDYKIKQALNGFATYFDEQRTADLQLIDYNLSNLQESTYDRFYQTDRVINQIIQTANLNR